LSPGLGRRQSQRDPDVACRLDAGADSTTIPDEEGALQEPVQIDADAVLETNSVLLLFRRALAAIETPIFASSDPV
jgi:hypothetical protein